MELGQKSEARKYFEKAHEADPDYPNTYYGLAYLAKLEGDHQSAFENSITALFKNDKRDQLYSLSFQMAEESAKELVAKGDEMGLVSDYVSELKEKTGKDIVVERDPKIPTAAKIEIAENYNRDYHLVKYKPDYPAVEHLIMHELSHLDFTADARNKKANLLFVTKDKYQEAFIKAFEKDIKKLSRQGFPEDKIAGYFRELFQGINRQAYNTPIDLFIEDMLYKKYRELRPYQFLSLFNMVLQGIDATTRKDIVKMVPQQVLSVSKVYNLVNALHFKSLYGFDLVRAHKPSNKEMRLANNLYHEFKEYRFDRVPGKEFQLVQRWAELMNIDKYFDLVPEALTKTKPVQDDPATYSEMKTADIELPSPEELTKKFIEEHSKGDVNMAVCMYMIGALKYFEQFPREDIKEMAFDIAMVGTSGIDPDKKGYTVPSIEGKEFSGYHLLAYYYVSWALAVPEMLSELQLPFDKEYEIARKFHG
jgi:tetratricopeptide (TPR) repeat protein